MSDDIWHDLAETKLEKEPIEEVIDGTETGKKSQVRARKMSGVQSKL